MSVAGGSLNMNWRQGGARGKEAGTVLGRPERCVWKNSISIRTRPGGRTVRSERICTWNFDGVQWVVFQAVPPRGGEQAPLSTFVTNS